MKRTLLPLLIAFSALLIFTSCSKNDPQPQFNTSVAGFYRVTYTITGSNDSIDGILSIQPGDYGQGRMILAEDVYNIENTTIFDASGLHFSGTSQNFAVNSSVSGRYRQSDNSYIRLPMIISGNVKERVSGSAAKDLPLDQRYGVSFNVVFVVPGYGTNTPVTIKIESKVLD